MIYAAFTVWFFVILFMGVGAYRLWAHLLRAGWISWALLPGTLVSELAYIFGSLITGGEIRQARLISSSGKSSGQSDTSEPTTEAAPKLRVIGPIIASMTSVIACAGGILLVNAVIGQDVIVEFHLSGTSLHQTLPRSVPEFWDLLEHQVRLLRRSFETWGRLEWSDWRTVLFVYLSLCLAVRLGPVRRQMRPTLAAVVLLAAIIAAVGALADRFKNLMMDIWPLVSYVYSTLLFVLVLGLVANALAGLVKILAGKSS